uniref:Uncharacterized protein n=1 Tax=Cacopsylla melanoneura TaxID=428564 RepID=A0A8D8SNL6_9HEMI
MFSNLTSYFWGGGSAAGSQEAVTQEPSSPMIEGDTREVSATGPEVVAAKDSAVTGGAAGAGMGVSLEMVIVKEDDGTGGDDEDWLMVDSSAGSEENKMEEAEAEEELAPLRPSAGGDTPPLPHSVVGMEESWIIAPTPTTLPCLVESAMEVSPLETLLIEHPSMSVYHKIDSPVRSLKLSTPTPASPAPPTSKPEAPTIQEAKITIPAPPVQPSPTPREHATPLPAPSVQPSPTPCERSQNKQLVVKKPSNQKSSKHPAKPPQIPFILQQKALQKHKSVPEPTTPTPATQVAKPAVKPASKAQVVVPNKTPKVKSKKVTFISPPAPVEKTKPTPAPSATKPLGEIQNVAAIAQAPTSAPKAAKKAAPAPMNRIVESNIKEMFPAHVYPKDMRPFVEDFQNNVNTRQHRELIAAQRRSQLSMTRSKRIARRNPFNVAADGDEMKTEATVMMEQKENNVVEMRRQEQFEILLRSSQKQQQKRFDQNLRKNHLSRSNKAIHEMSSRNKRQRRSDHTLKPSGASNNRKVNTQ